MEIKAGHGLRGYRAVWDILRKDYGLTVKRLLLWMAHPLIGTYLCDNKKCNRKTDAINERA